MSERAFQKAVVDGLKQRGYRVFVVPDMRRTLAGLPDLICVKPGRVLFWELKRERGRVRPEQREVIGWLEGGATVDARIVRPSTWDRLKDGEV